MELFCSVFKKICVHTYCFGIVFTRPHYNTISVLEHCYTLSVHGQMNSTHAHFNISARKIGMKLKLHGSSCPPFWILTVKWSWWRHRFQIASFSLSTLENSIFKKHRFQISPLWRAFSNGSVFGDCSVDDSRIRSKTAPFSFENGLVWTGPYGFPWKRHRCKILVFKLFQILFCQIVHSCWCTPWTCCTAHGQLVLAGFHCK